MADVDRRETELVALRLRDAVSEVALDRNAALLRVERTHLTEELERQRETMSTLEQGQVAVASLKALREHMCDRLDSATPETAALSWRPG
jgi:DNA-binding Xre family transcriptional regulator